jgi:hypothetical protein
MEEKGKVKQTAKTDKNLICAIDKERPSRQIKNMEADND